MQITDKSIALITGASSGIGAALAVAMGLRNARIGLCARRRDRLEEVAARVSDAGGTPLVIETDLTQQEEAAAAVQRVIDHFGGLDILVNNAGRGNMASVEDTSTEQLESIFALNAFALWYTTAAALPAMKKNGRGSIVNVSSIAGKMAFPFNSAYVAAKHACVGFTAALRAELVGTGIDATVVCPAGVKTEWADITEGGPIGELFAKAIRLSKKIAEERGTGLAPLHPMMSAEEVADIIVKTIEYPTGSDVFTHPGTYEHALLAARERRLLEDQMMPLFLAMQKTYPEMQRNA